MPTSRSRARSSSIRGTFEAVVAVTGLLIASPADALTVIGNGLAPPNPLNVIDATDPPDEDYRVASDPCWVFVPGVGCLAPPLLSTAVEVQSGAEVGSIEALGHSYLDVVGGFVQRITLEDTSSLLLNPFSGIGDPSDYVGFVRAFDDASVVVQGDMNSHIRMAGSSTLTHLGTITGIVEVTEHASMTLQGGPVATGRDSGVLLSGSGYLEMISGRITDNGLQALGDSRITMSGGSIDVLGVQLFDHAWMNWLGGDINEVTLFDTSVMTIAGGMFEIDGVPLELGAVAATSGLLTGTLANGDALSVPFSREPGTQLVLVPEPSTFGMLGLGLLVLSARSHRLWSQPGGSSSR